MRLCGRCLCLARRRRRQWAWAMFCSRWNSRGGSCGAALNGRASIHSAVDTRGADQDIHCLYEPWTFITVFTKPRHWLGRSAQIIFLLNDPTDYLYLCVCIYRVQNVFLRCPTPRLHCFLSSHWPSFRFLSFMAFLILSIQFFFGLPRALFCFGIHFSAILGSLSSAILWTWPYHVSWFCSISFIIISSSPVCCLI